MTDKKKLHRPKVREVTGKLKECIDNQTKEGLDKARRQLEEEPKKCMYTQDYYTDEDRKVLCEGCEEECRFSRKGLNTSERELIATREALAYVNNINRGESPWTDSDMEEAYEEGYKSGAKWQMEKDYKDGLQNDNFLTFAYMDGLEKGKQEMEKQMIKEAMECTIEGVIGCDSLLRIKGRYKYGEKVKVIIVKDQ